MSGRSQSWCRFPGRVRQRRWRAAIRRAPQQSGWGAHDNVAAIVPCPSDRNAWNTADDLGHAPVARDLLDRAVGIEADRLIVGRPEDRRICRNLSFGSADRPRLDRVEGALPHSHHTVGAGADEHEPFAVGRNGERARFTGLDRDRDLEVNRRGAGGVGPLRNAFTASAAAAPAAISATAAPAIHGDVVRRAAGTGASSARSMSPSPRNLRRASFSRQRLIKCTAPAGVEDGNADQSGSAVSVIDSVSDSVSP